MQTLLENKRPSDRKFGFTFAVIFVAFFVYGVFASWAPIISSLCALAGVSLFLLAAIAPQLLRPLNRAWFALGELLGKFISPLALGFIFYALITPISVITRLFGRDELRLKRRAERSYWVARETPDPAPNTFKQQF